MDRLTEVKKLIRSILIPQKNGYTIEQLSEDYFEMEGLGLPFQEFKYSSIIEFLKSMPDTVKFIGNKCYPVSDSSTAHIERMVAEQRDSGSGRRPPPRPQRSAPPVRRDSENHRREFDSHNRRPPPRIRTPSPARPVEVPSLEVCQNLRNASPSRRSPTFDELFRQIEKKRPPSQKESTPIRSRSPRRSPPSRRSPPLKRSSPLRSSPTTRRSPTTRWSSPIRRSPSRSPRRNSMRRSPPDRRERDSRRFSRSKSRSPERRRSRRRSRSRERSRNRHRRSSTDRSDSRKANETPKKVSVSIQVEADELKENTFTPPPAPSVASDFITIKTNGTFFKVSDDMEISSPSISSSIESWPQPTSQERIEMNSHQTIDWPDEQVSDRDTLTSNKTQVRPSDPRDPRRRVPDDPALRDPRLRKRLMPNSEPQPQPTFITPDNPHYIPFFDFPDNSSDQFEVAIKNLYDTFSTNPENCYQYYLHAYGWGWHEVNSMPAAFAPISTEDPLVLHPWYEQDPNEPGKYYDYNLSSYSEIPLIPYTFSRFLVEAYPTVNPFLPIIIPTCPIDNLSNPKVSAESSTKATTNQSKKKLSLSDYLSQKKGALSKAQNVAINVNRRENAPCSSTSATCTVQSSPVIRDPRLRR